MNTDYVELYRRLLSYLYDDRSSEFFEWLKGGSYYDPEQMKDFVEDYCNSEENCLGVKTVPELEIQLTLRGF